MDTQARSRRFAEVRATGGSGRHERRGDGMKTIRLSERAGEDGVLHLRIPVGCPDAEFDAVVVLQPSDPQGDRRVGTDSWPAGYFEGVAGSIDDETFDRPPPPKNIASVGVSHAEIVPG